jgi:serine/threonine-protein kinase
MANFQIDAASWTALSRALDEVLDLPPQARSAWLENLAPEYSMLKPQLLDLLVRTQSFQDSKWTLPSLDLTTTPADQGSSVSSEKAGDIVGSYRLVREIATGGMGTVWLAERSDGLMTRSVAMKLPRGSWGGGMLRERMAREREILAGLNHPNIARLYDAGLKSDGQPYLALEYVEGKPIDQHSNEQHLDIPARLRLFLQVANAVAHAHARLVVHRDLKPTNILVTAEGEVRLLDFGIAKLLEGQSGEATNLTQLAGQALTPAYASPEQVAGSTIGIASDIYSLGIVLYELLTSCSPYRPARESRGALEEAILHQEPIQPSEVNQDPFMRRALRGDLDLIVLKALKKKPEERYATVNAFAEDIERYLDGRPVQAQPDRWSYRGRKFVRRHRVGVAAAAAVLFAIVLGAGVALWQARVARAEKRRAEEVKEFIAGIFRDANLDEGEGKSLTALDVLKRAGERIDTTLGHTPQVRGDLLNIIGSSLMSLGDTAAAEQVADRAVAEASRAGTMGPQYLRARLLRSWVLMFRGKTKEMRVELDGIWSSVLSSGNLTPEDSAFAWRLRCGLAIDEGQSSEAETACAEAVKLAESKLGPHHRETLLDLLELAYAHSQNHHGDLEMQTAERAYRLALETYRSNPLHPTVIKARVAYGNALAETEQLAAAIEQLTQARRDAARLFGPASMTVGVYAQNVVDIQLRAGLVKEALESSATALPICEQYFQPGSLTHMSAVKSRGMALREARKMDEALPEFTRANHEATQIFGPLHGVVLGLRAFRAEALAWTGATEEATREMESALRDIRKNDPSLTYYGLRESGIIQRIVGNYQTALGLQEQALAAIANDGRKSAREALTLLEIGIDQQELHRYKQAADTLARARVLLDHIDLHVDPYDADAMVGLGRAKLGQHRPAEALPLLEEGDRFWRDFDPKNRWAGEAAFWLGRCYASMGRQADATKAISRGVHILSRSPIPSDSKLVARARLG